MAAQASTAAPRRGLDQRSRFAQIADPAFRNTLTVVAALILVIIAFFFIFLIAKARPALAHQGVLSFIFTNDWNPGAQIYGAWPLVAGSLITAATALVIGVPIALAAALYIGELAPRRVAAPLAMLVDLLAAVPSVVYGLWGIFVLIPALRPIEQWFSDTFSFLPFVGGNVAGPNYFIAGLILAIMIMPIVSAISRDVIATVPRDHKEAALALGATRWEMLRIAVLPYSRAGIVGASMLGLGRAIGETIAVTLVIGNASVVGSSIFDQGYTLAAVVANEFGEAAADDLHTGALIAAGLVLFVLTLVINGAARALVNRAERKQLTVSAPEPAAAASAAVGA
ncbi:MAG TPA: phosphate ABC transporter permease subunit PstC [Solirubrobacteraceae bacterium]|nr:phosphate ABC transporter permease subunit PstC [Solirubrobacteraceae bacterium]